MIQTTLGPLVDAVEAMQAVMALPLPSVTAYRMAKLAKRVFEEVEAFYAQRNAALRRLGTPQEGSADYAFDEANKIVFTNEMKTLMGVAVELPFAPILLSALGASKIEAKHLLALERASLLTDDTEPRD